MDQAKHTFEISQQTFNTDVVHRSQEVPVVVLCWTSQYQSSVETKTILEGLAAQFQGKFVLGLIDVARDPMLVRQLQVQTVPSIRVVVDGAIAGQLDGPQSEAVLRDVVAKLTQSSGEKLQDSLDDIRAAGDWDKALQIIRQALIDEPNNAQFQIELADVLVCKGEVEEASTVLAAIDDQVQEKIRPQNRLELVEEVAGMRPVDELQQCLFRSAEDLDALYELAVHYAVALKYRESLSALLHIVQTDAQFRDEIGRTTMIRVMSLMPKDSPIAKQYRQQLFSLLH